MSADKSAPADVSEHAIDLGSGNNAYAQDDATSITTISATNDAGESESENSKKKSENLATPEKDDNNDKEKERRVRNWCIAGGTVAFIGVAWGCFYLDRHPAAFDKLKTWGRRVLRLRREAKGPGESNAGDPQLAMP